MKILKAEGRVNFQSLLGKREAFWNLLGQVQPDIVLGSETWMTANMTESEMLPPTYKFAAQRDRPGSAHGGVAVITKTNLETSEILISSDVELAAVSIQTRGKPLVVCSLYRPPDNNSDYSQRLCNAMTDLHRKHRNHVI